MVPVTKYVKPVLQSGCVLLPYKTKLDLIGNRFFCKNFDISGQRQNASVFVRARALRPYV